MTDENVAVAEPVAEPVQEVMPEFKTAEDIILGTTAAPTGKKRGRKPKVAAIAPPPAPEPAKPVARKRKKANVVRLSAADRAFQSAIQKTEDDRSKVIEEMSKIMEMWDVKQARLKALDWKLSTLRGTTQTSAIASMQLTPYGQPPQPQAGYYPPQMNYPPQGVYPNSPQTPAYIPPAMRKAAAAPVEPRANGGSEGIIDDGGTQNGEEDQFLSGGTAGGSRGWV